MHINPLNTMNEISFDGHIRLDPKTEQTHSQLLMR